ncbi:MAG: phenylacetate--CoA ligase [Candidatus Raymondbacteria bacterium RifOxyA12_full_50_37]|nr:MAG: phenylacetate--CoA ligase [Candidatus Raymondbacteria bacterium RifOxyA12_full_50_37]OGJ92137.1 MAG: phenylacetate--CoA ligase [Candidatus Raymondbacteria bacterium RifOxyB12_full_50_8]OGJ97694.1 MAG: phenylacetate--CoA ligase [Candidatus Raymondbacteria bacterium RIFOXYC2_FULL_50_21]OGP43651.1 MAG: phenylacetate--CoA ligase [Candidatus Raymondbacteria bacterium RIFOXYB2_FULL_49_35]
MIHTKKAESMPRDDIDQLQVEKLQTTLNRVYRNVAFYKNRFDQCATDIGKIGGVNDMRHLPLTSKADLATSYPYGMFAVPLRDIVRIHTTSGATGRPIVMGYTKNDLCHWAELVARSLSAAGINEHDFVQVAFSYSLFTGGLGFHYGAELIGASVIPSSESADMRKQITVMKDYKVTALVSTPTYALKLAHELREMGVHPEELHLKNGVFGAEPWNQTMREQIEERLHINAFDNYGISEVLGPGIAAECECKNGLHVNEDHFIAEIIDPKTLEPVSEGVQGEVVLTTITKEGFPLVRYRTGDLASLMPGACACGRTFRRLSRVSGRTDDLIIIKGMKFFPSQIEEVLHTVEKITPHYQVVISRNDGLDEMELRVEMSDKIPFFDEIRKLEELKADISRHIKQELNITAKVIFVEPGSFIHEPGKKAKRVIDRR